MLPKGTFTPEIIEEEAEALRKMFRVAGVADKFAAGSIGENAQDLSALFSAVQRPKMKPEKAEHLIRALNRWFELYSRNREIRTTERLIHTSVIDKGMRAARNTHSLRCIGVLTGGSGIGKTTLCRYLASPESPLPGTALVEMNSDCTSAGGLRYEIYEAIRSRRGQRMRVTLRHIMDEFGDTGRLLVIDQAHVRTSATILQTYMSLNDMGVPILLVGTREISDATESASLDRWIGQLSSRIGWRENLNVTAMGTRGGGLPTREWITVEQLRGMFQGNKIRLNSDALRMLITTACRENGHLREVKFIVKLAEACARGAGRDFVNSEDVRAAMDERSKARGEKEKHMHTPVAEQALA